VVGCKKLPGFFCTLFKYYNHEGAHEEGSVGLLGVVKRGIVVNLEVFVL
jgi:hypothetical protein